MPEYLQLTLFPLDEVDGTEPMTWATSGITALEQAIMRQVAYQFPDGAYAAFVRLMDAAEERKQS